MIFKSFLNKLFPSPEVKKMGNPHIQELFQKLEKTEILIDYKESKEKVTLGKSKFGGNPHLPKNFEWYWFEGTSFGHEGAGNHPLLFLAQINLAEVAQYDKDHLLPTEGILYFFHGWQPEIWHFKPKDKGSAKIYYYTGKIDDLVETAPPTDMKIDHPLPEFDLSFSNKPSLPNGEEFYTYYKEYCNQYGVSTLDISNEGIPYYDEIENYGFKFNDCDINKLLGYADCVQAPMLLECETNANGIYWDSKTGIPEEQKDAFLKNSLDWTLLFQMSTINDKKNPGKFTLIFGDCGNIYFYIKKEDLANRNFENISIILQF